MAIDGLATLVKVMVELYPDDGSIRRIAREVNLNITRMEGGSTYNLWSEVLNEAHNQDKLSDVIAVAVGEYPNHKPLADAVHTARIILPGAGIDAVELRALQRSVAIHENKIAVMWKSLHPTAKQRLANVMTAIIVLAGVILLVVPTTSTWMLEHPAPAAIGMIAMAVLAALIRILPNGS